jgi:hypothetical protein
VRRSSTIIRITLLVCAVLLLEILCQKGVISPLQLTAPSKMVTTLVDLMGTDEFWHHAIKTVRNIFIAIILAAVLGFLFGLLLFRMPRLRRAMEPVISSYYALPFFVLYPLAIVIVGMNDVSIIIMGYAYALVAMITNTLSGLDRIPPVLARTGQTFRMGRLETAVLLRLLDRLCLRRFRERENVRPVVVRRHSGHDHADRGQYFRKAFAVYRRLRLDGIDRQTNFPRRWPYDQVHRWNRGHHCLSGNLASSALDGR